MKILHIHPAMKGGGIESMICALANEMSKTENVTVCSLFQPQPDDVFWNKLSPNVHKKTLGKCKEGISFKEIFKIYQYIKKERFDVVNVHGKFYYYALSVLLLNKKVKFFYTVHSDAKMENLGWDRWIFFLKKFCFRKKIIHPITISKTSQKSFAMVYGCYSDLIYNGVKRPLLSGFPLADNYKISEQTKVFIHAGRIDVPKNQIVLCKVFDKLIKEGHDVVLLIAGSKQRCDIFNSIKHFFGERIIYLGERNDIPQLMSCCVAMCLPSIWEGLPVTLLEAFSVGCIPICSNVGGIPDVVSSGYNGILSSSPSEEDYYQAMKEFLLLSNEDIGRLSDNCRVSFENYNIVNTVTTYIKTYKSY